MFALNLEWAPADWPELPPAEVAFLCAARTSIAACRADPAGARRVNFAGPVALGRHLRARGARVVLLSSSAVFDGARPQRPADEPTCPTMDYGRDKADAERELLTVGITVLRLSKVLFPGFPLFAGWIEALRAGREIAAFADHTLAPVALDDTVAVLAELAALPANRASGVFQYTGTRDISYLEAARHIARQLGAAAELVRPASAAERGIPAAERPRHTSLDGSRLVAELGIAPPDPEDVLDRVFALVA